jgi:hypothetical protein
MKELTLGLLLAAALASPCAADPDLAADVAASTRTAVRSGTVFLRVEPVGGASPYHRRTTIGLGRVLGEGKPLEVLVWGTGGAVAGSVAGPPGALIGAGVGALAGWMYSVFVVPHNGPEPKPQTASTIDNHSPRGE